MSVVSQYISEVQKAPQLADVREYAYRSSFQSQPAHEWLKDRKELMSIKEINLYQKMIVSTNKIIKLMKGIDKLMPV